MSVFSKVLHQCITYSPVVVPLRMSKVNGLTERQTCADDLCSHMLRIVSKCGASTPALSICTTLQHARSTSHPKHYSDSQQGSQHNALGDWPKCHLSCCIPFTDQISWVTACIIPLNDIEACGHVILKPQQTGVTSHVMP